MVGDGLSFCYDVLSYKRNSVPKFENYALRNNWMAPKKGKLKFEKFKNSGSNEWSRKWSNKTQFKMEAT